MLEDEDNPDRVSQAANSLRELTEKLYFLIPFKKEEEVHREQLRVKMKGKLEECLSIYTDGWQGGINPVLAGLLEDLNAYLVEKPRQNRKLKLHKVIEFSDPMSPFLPVRIAEERSKMLKELSEFLERATHHGSNYSELPKLQEKVQLVEKLILDYLSPSTVEHGKRLRELSAATYDNQSLEEALSLIRVKGANHVLFFETLQDPSWLLPLFNNGYFKNPPSIRESKNGQHHPAWPESQCLVRLYEKAPRNVIEIIKALPPLHNVQVYYDIAQIAQKISSPEESEILLNRLCEYAGNYRKFDGSALGDILSHWIHIGAVNHALILLKQIVTFYPDPKGDEKRKLSGMPYYLDPIDPNVPFDSWEFSEILSRGVRDVSVAAPTETAKLLIEALHQMLLLKADGRSYDNGQDWSKYWCDVMLILSDGGVHVEADRALVYSTLAACKEVFRKKNSDWEIIHHLLLEEKSLIYRRIRWFIYTSHIEELLGPIREDVLSDQNHYGTKNYEDEFAQMVKAAATTCGNLFLSKEEWQGIWLQISDGVDLEISIYSTKEGKTSEEVASRKKYLFYRYLHPFVPLLSEEQRILYEAARETWGEIVDNQSIRGGDVIQKSPIDSDELGKMSNSDLATYLNNWEPKGTYTARNGQYEDVSIDGLSTAFSAVAKRDLSRFVNWPSWWEKIRRPIFLHSFFGVGVELIKAKEPITEQVWNQFLTLCKWVIERPNEERVVLESEAEKPSEYSGTKPDYQGVEMMAAFFIEEALQTTGILPGMFRNFIFALIKRMATKHDKSLDENLIESSEYLLDIAMNSHRGRAIDLLARYAFWVRRDLSQEDEIAEIWPLLKEIISPENGGHPAVFAAVSEHIMLWLRLNPTWVRANKSLIFPQKQELWLASWHNFLRATPASKEIFIFFEEEYIQGTKQIPYPKSVKPHKNSSEVRLGTRLIQLAWQGIVPIDEGLLKDFYKQASVETRTEVARSALLSLKRIESVSPRILLRVQKFVEWRLACLLKVTTDRGFWDANRAETEMYPRWLESAHFPFQWRLSQLCQYSKKVDIFRTSHFNIDSLIDLLPSETNRVAEIFLSLVQKTPTTDGIFWNFDNMKTIINCCISNGDEQSKDNAKEALNLLLNRGYSTLSDS